MIKDKKANITLYFMFFVAGSVILVLAAVLSPLGVRMTSEMYLAGEDILNMSQPTIAQIDNVEVRTNLEGAVDDALASGETNIEVLTDFYQYAWVVVVVLTALIVFLLSRAISEYSRTGGLV